MPGVRTACSGGWVCQHSFFPGLKEMHPSATKGAREPTGCVLSKVGQEDLSRWSCCHWIMGKECTLTPSIRSESELLDLHGPRGPRPTGNRGGLKKSKDKGKRSKQRRIAKRRNERPSTHPENNRQRPPDHQARRRSRKETLTHPLTQVAQNGRERAVV